MLTKALFPDVNSVGVVPTFQVLTTVPLSNIQPLAANVAPFSNPPSPAGSINVVCALLEALKRKMEHSNNQAR